MATSIFRRRLRLIGHFLRKAKEDITKTALQWTTECKRKSGRIIVIFIVESGMTQIITELA